MAAIKQTPCFCQSFEFGEFDGENENAVSYDTNCAQMTTRVFAQGHDAKLAGYLVRAEMAGEEIRMVEGGVAISSDAMGMARKVSDAFAAKVELLLSIARERVAKKELNKAKKATKTAKKVVVELAPIEARIKVGRWSYNAQIDRGTRYATFTTKLGVTKMLPEGKYEVL
jgi:hypothetical protein